MLVDFSEISHYGMYTFHVCTIVLYSTTFSDFFGMSISSTLCPLQPQTLCDLPLDRAGTISSCLQNYFSGLSQRKSVIKNVDLKSFVKCFELSSKVGNFAIGSEEGGDVTRSLSHTYSSQPIRLSLKEGLATSTLLDIGQ